MYIAYISTQCCNIHVYGLKAKKIQIFLDFDRFQLILQLMNANLIMFKTNSSVDSRNVLVANLKPLYNSELWPRW